MCHSFGAVNCVVALDKGVVFMKKIKKGFLCTTVMVFAFIVLLILVFASQPLIEPLLKVNMSMRAMQVMANAMPSMTHKMMSVDIPGDEIVTPIYTENGKRIFYNAQFGLMYDDDGRFIYNPANSAPIFIDSTNEEQRIIDTANNAMGIYFNSFLDKHFLRTNPENGNIHVRSVSIHNEVFMINVKPAENAEAFPIYAYRVKRTKTFLEEINPAYWGVTLYRYQDLKGHTIEERFITEMKPAPWWSVSVSMFIGTIVLTPFLGVLAPFVSAGIIVNNGLYMIRMVDAVPQGTLGSLLDLLEHATFHPWDNLYDAGTNEPLRTSDGSLVWLNPKSKQLTDKFRWPLFNSENGLPIILYNNDVVTIDLDSQPIVDGVLVDALTIHEIMTSGRDFYIGQRTTAYGVFDVLMFRVRGGGGDGEIKDDEWILPNGANAKPWVDDFDLDSDIDADVGRRNSEIFQFIMWTIMAVTSLAVLILVIFLLVYFAPLVRPVFETITIPFKWLGRRFQK